MAFNARLIRKCGSNPISVCICNCTQDILPSLFMFAFSTLGYVSYQFSLPAMLFRHCVLAPNDNCSYRLTIARINFSFVSWKPQVSGKRPEPARHREVFPCWAQHGKHDHKRGLLHPVGGTGANGDEASNAGGLAGDRRSVWEEMALPSLPRYVKQDMFSCLLLAEIRTYYNTPSSSCTSSAPL